MVYYLAVCSQSLTARNRHRRKRCIGWSGIRWWRMKIGYVKKNRRWTDSLSLSSIRLIIHSFFVPVCHNFSQWGHCSNIKKYFDFFTVWQTKHFVFYLLLPSKCNTCPGSWFLSNGIPTHGKLQKQPSLLCLLSSETVQVQWCEAI